MSEKSPPFKLEEYRLKIAIPGRPDALLDSAFVLKADADSILALASARIAELEAQRDAAVRLSRCECGSDELCENLVRLHARIAELEAAAKWNPMETAPISDDWTRPARVLLLLGNGGVSVGFWNDDRHARKPRPFWENDRDMRHGVTEVRRNQPVGWRHLPPETKGFV